MEEGLVQPAGLAGARFVQDHFDAGLAQAPETQPAYAGIGIFDRRHDARHSGRNDGIGAGTRAPLVRAWLQGHVKRRPARPFAGLFERQDFGVLYPAPGVEPAAHHLGAADHDRADHGIRARKTNAAPRKRERFRHVVDCHANSDSINFSASKGSRSSTFSPTPT